MYDSADRPIDVRTNRIFTVCRDSKTLLAMDATTGAIVSTVPIGANSDGVIYEKILKVLITANGDGTATIIAQKSADQYAVIQTIKTQPGLRTIIHRQISHNAYLSGAAYEADGKTIKPNSFGVFVFAPNAQ